MLERFRAQILAAFVAAFVATLALVMPSLVLTAQAYDGCQGESSITSSSQTAAGGGSVTVTVTIRDCNGNAVQGATVTFSQQSGPGTCQATISPTTAVTDVNGQASATVTLPVNCPGTYSVQAAAKGVTMTLALRETGGFPNTTTPAPTHHDWLPQALGALALLLVASGGALTLLPRR